MNEWEFTQLAATWMQQAIDADPSLPFRHARTEQTTSGSIKRRDLTLLDAGNRPLLTGEVKMPFQPEGNSPYRYDVVRDARAKAKHAKCDFCFTWNINRLVLWPTTPQVAEGRLGTTDDAYQAWDDIVAVYRDDQLQLDATHTRIKRFLVTFLHEAAHIVRGDKQLGWRPPDEKFVGEIEAALEQPILLTTDALAALYKHSRDREALQAWMREEQGWVIADPADVRGTLDNLTDAARFANYALMNKVVFHEALVRRYPHDLNPIGVPDYIAAGDALRVHFEAFFQRARDFTRDYQTVFGEHQHAAVAPRIPFYADPAVAYWRELVAQIHEFDFSKLDYEVIGTLFERLISPEERHKFGQYYTRAEVVDLINSFCIRTGRERVMDPACGGGTFLVRAYARKRELNPAATHVDRLGELYGIDLSHFAANLTTINLATRDLISNENYPQVARSDFFNVEPTRPLMNLPAHITTAGLGAGQSREVHIQPLDAIVGNPPYVRQEDIPSTPKGKKGEKRAPKPGTKEFYQDIAQRAAGIKFSGRSDLHIYFWPHAAEFLHDGGWLCLLTSSQWLDVDYGFRLQEYILRNFEIHAIFESVEEPWFVGARVVTCATILRRQRREETRMSHPVRFVQLRRPIAEVLDHDGTTAGAMAAADTLRDALLSAAHNAVTRDYRVRVINQGHLWREGVRIGRLVKGKKERKQEKDTTLGGHQSGDYFGGKWGQYVRAPDLWFDILDRCGANLVPLAKVADVRFGVKSGDDGFFFPVDCSSDLLARYPDAGNFMEACGVQRKDVESGKLRVVRCGEKLAEIRPLEAEFLEPEIHSLMKVKRHEVGFAEANRLILLTGAKTEKLPKYVRQYVKWGESNGVNKKPTCASRQSDARDWHDLSSSPRASIILPKIMQYRPLTFANPKGLYQGSALLGIYNVRRSEVDLVAGILNSTWAILSILTYARLLGNEANIQLDVYSAKMMLVPDFSRATKQLRETVTKAFRSMRGRDTLGFVSRRRLKRYAYEQKGLQDRLAQLSDETELDREDRRKLDEAVLEMMGVTDGKLRRRLMEELYAFIRQHFEEARRKEEKANVNKKKTKKRGRGSLGAMTQNLVDQLRRERPEIFRRYPQHFIDAPIMAASMIDTYEVPSVGTPEAPQTLLDGSVILRLRKGKRTTAEFHPKSMAQANLLMALITQNMRRFISVPHEAADCEQVHKRFLDWIAQRDEAIRIAIERQTADEELQQSLRDAVTPMTWADLRHLDSAGPAII